MNTINLEECGYGDYFKSQENDIRKEQRELIAARITEVHKEQYKIICSLGEYSAKLKGSFLYSVTDSEEYPTVGDFVLVKLSQGKEAVIYDLFRRKSKFSRFDTVKKSEQLVASNFDYVFIMTSLNYDLNLRRLERYLTVAWESGGIPVIILTKSDLCDNINEKKAEVMKVALGVSVISLSSFTGEGLENVASYFEKGKTVVFLGSSGVGKSSLVNAIIGETIMDVNSIREDDSRGRHTTTHRQLIKLRDGGMIIDTPGMRELSAFHGENGMERVFDDIEEIAKECRFRDCNHDKEPGCAVKKALDNGEISCERWESYMKLRREVRFIEKKYAGEKVKQKKANRRKYI